MRIRSASVSIVWTGALLLALPAGFARAQGADAGALRDAAGVDDNLAAVRRLLDAEAGPNVPDTLGRTAVHHAADGGAARNLDVLLAAGGDPDARDRDGNTPLHLAAGIPIGSARERQSVAAVRVLLGHGANPGFANRTGETPLHLAAGSHDTPAGVEALLAAGADPDRADERGETPLHAALGPNRGPPGVVAALLGAGASPEATNRAGRTPLLHFVHRGPDRGAPVALLLDAGADPDAKDPAGDTPLHIAIREGGSRGKEEVVEALLAGNADPCVRDARGHTPYHIAPEGGAIHRALDRAGGYDRACDRRRGYAAARAAEEALGLDRAQRRRIQEGLAAAGFDPGPADGAFGPRTREALGAWQQARSRAATGYLDEGTARVLLGGAARAAALEPKCAELAGDDAECWLEIAGRSGCHVWNLYGNVAIEDWSGRCSGGVAEGRGTMSMSDSGRPYWEGTGTLADGKMRGHWTERFADGTVGEGSYIDSKADGHWIWRRNGVVTEGPYVDHKAHGNWTERFPDGHCNTFEMSRGEMVDGSVRYDAC